MASSSIKLLDGSAGPAALGAAAAGDPAFGAAGVEAAPPDSEPSKPNNAPRSGEACALGADAAGAAAGVDEVAPERDPNSPSSALKSGDPEAGDFGAVDFGVAAAGAGELAPENEPRRPSSAPSESEDAEADAAGAEAFGATGVPPIRDAKLERLFELSLEAFASFPFAASAVGPEMGRPSQAYTESMTLVRRASSIHPSRDSLENDVQLQPSSGFLPS